MHLTEAKENIAKLKKQKNYFIAITCLVVIANIFLSLKIVTSDQKIILVPALRHEMMISKTGVSKSYLEAMSYVFLNNLLDLNPNDVGYKKELIINNSVSNDKKAINRLLEYFTIAERKYKTFGLSTRFTVSSLEIDLENLTVIAHGQLASYYGKSGHESEKEDYQLEFEYQDGVLRIKSFTRIMDEEKKARDKAKNKDLGKEVEVNLDSKENNLEQKEESSETLIKEEMNDDDLPE